MSYEIVYDRQFIKTRDEKFMLMTYWGSNNCYETDWSGRSTRRERDWSPFCHKAPLTREEILAYWEDVRQEYINSSSEQYPYSDERFFSHMALQIGDKSSYKDFVNWLETGMKKAITFDQLKEMDYKLSLRAEHEFRDSKTVVNGYEPFNILTNDENEFISHINKAMGNYKGIYISLNGGDNFGKWARQRFFPRKRKYDTKELTTLDKYYTIKVVLRLVGEVYLVKHTSSATRYDMSYPSKKYATMEEAQKVVDRYNKKYGPTKKYSVEEVNETTNMYV